MAYVQLGNAVVGNNEDNNDWDMLPDTIPVSVEHAITPTFVRVLLRAIKLVVYVATLTAVLLFGFISKSLTLLMTSMAQPDHLIAICVSRCDRRNIVPPLDPTIKQYWVKYDVRRAARVPWIWLLFTATVLWYGVAFIRFLLKWINVNAISLKKRTWFWVFFLETLQSIGLSVLMFVVLPRVDVILGAMMMSSVCLVPCLLRWTTSPGGRNQQLMNKIENTRMLSGLLLGAQLLTIIGWTVIGYMQIGSPYFIAWIPLALILTSLEWWENYLKPRKGNSVPKWLAWLESVRQELTICRHKVYCLVSLWKIAVSFGVLLLREYFEVEWYHPGTWGNLFRDASLLQHGTILVVGGDSEQQKVEHTLTLDISPYWPVYLLLAHFGCNVICRFLTRYACKICIHKIGFSTPICLVTILTPMVLYLISTIQPCHDHYLFNEVQRPYFFWTMQSVYDFWHYFAPVGIIWLVALLSQFGNSLHIWGRINERMARNLFINTCGDGMLIDQSLMMRKRRAKVREFKLDYENIVMAMNAAHGRDNVNDGTVVNVRSSIISNVDVHNPDSDNTIRLFVCITLWHEKQSEMVQTLKSVLLLDFDQATRRIVKDKYRNPEAWEYYEMEVHVMFDDAFEGKQDGSRKLNQYVEVLLKAVGEAVGQVYGQWNIKMTIDKPTVMCAPYGGKLIWQLPSGNKLVAHLKDQHLVRKRKRWSQHRLQETNLDEMRKLRRAHNTFILTLDGDIAFEPSAVDMVLDLMKKNPNLGAACGRIHPVGSGVMVWYQKFEYAVGHWFQKSTEHKFGSVLCSPGCFSLLRGRALMDKEVMSKYTKESTRGLDYVQFDQGEDRWLCNLLIQRGWRIEYCAASDSYTHAPEGFGEFFKQRRRWVPSTMANILELLFINPRQTIRINENISKLYIVYQFCLLGSTALSPAIVFLIVVSGLNSGLHFGYTAAFWCTLTPIVVFAFVCTRSSSEDLKLNFAFILSVLSALLMLISILGNIIHIIDTSIFSPDALLFVIIMGCYFLAAILHPQELFSVLVVPVYLLFVPSMYLLLLIYSLTNMNETSWGTRETAQQSNSEDDSPLDYQDEEQQHGGDLQEDENTTDNDSDHLLIRPSNGSFGRFWWQMLCFCSKKESSTRSIRRRIPKKSSNKEKQIKVSAEEGASTSSQNSPSSSEAVPNDNPPFWIRNCADRLGHLKHMDKGEEEFWHKMIRKCLRPLLEDTGLEEITSTVERREVERKILDIKTKLASLRNRAVFAFGMLNVIFIVMVYMFQLNRDEFDFVFTLGGAQIRIDPSGFLLLIIFGVILVFQIIGMLFHRFTTFCHLLAYTEMDFWHSPENGITLAKKFIQISQYSQEERELSILSPNGTLRQINRNTIPRGIIEVSKEYTRLDEVYEDRIGKFRGDHNEDNRKRLPSELKKIVKAAIDQDR